MIVIIKTELLIFTSIMIIPSLSVYGSTLFLLVQSEFYTLDRIHHKVHEIISE